jgi:hypothetical protein
VLGAEFRGDLSVDFFGAASPSTTPSPRLRTARTILTWKHAELLLGRDTPLASTLNPVTLASIGTPSFSASGNLWRWLPQLRVTVERGQSVRIALQGAVLAPFTWDDAYTAYGAPVDTEYASSAEHSHRPFVEGRLRVRWGDEEAQGEIGLSLHRGWFAMSPTTLATASGVMADALIPLGRSLEFRGEAFSGRGLSSLGGGQIGQLFGQNDRLIRGGGAWGQINVKPSPRVIIGAGLGVDDPNDADILSGGLYRNATREVHWSARPAGPLVIGAEWRRTSTTYRYRVWTNDHLNLSFGFEF